MLFVFLFMKNIPPFLWITFHSNLCENCSECGLKGRLKPFKQMDQTKCHGGGVIKRYCSNMDRDDRNLLCKNKMLYIAII